MTGTGARSEPATLVYVYAVSSAEAARWVAEVRPKGLERGSVRAALEGRRPPIGRGGPPGRRAGPGRGRGQRGGRAAERARPAPLGAPGAGAGAPGHEMLARVSRH